MPGAEAFSDKVDEIKGRFNREVTDIILSADSKKPCIRRGLYLALYAVYEGTCREAVFEWAQYINSLGLSASSSSHFVICAKLKEQLRNLQGTDSCLAIHDFYQSAIDPGKRIKLDPKKVADTNANLNFSRLESFKWFTTGIVDDIAIHRNFIDEQLLARRNGLAHGECDWTGFTGVDPIDIKTAGEELRRIVTTFLTELVNSVALETYKLKQ